MIRYSAIVPALLWVLLAVSNVNATLMEGGDSSLYEPVIYKAVNGSWPQNDEVGNGDADSVPVPEPSTLMLIGSGLVVLGSVGLRRNRRRR